MNACICRRRHWLGWDRMHVCSTYVHTYMYLRRGAGYVVLLRGTTTHITLGSRTGRASPAERRRSAANTCQEGDRRQGTARNREKQAQAILDQICARRAACRWGRHDVVMVILDLLPRGVWYSHALQVSGAFSVLTRYALPDGSSVVYSIIYFFPGGLSFGEAVHGSWRRKRRMYNVRPSRVPVDRTRVSRHLRQRAV